MIDLVAERLEDIAAVCRRFGVRRLDLIGSAATGDFNPATSDLDFVAAFAGIHEPDFLGRYLDFADALEAMFGRSVDVLIDGSIRNPRYRELIDAIRQPIYDAQDAPAVA
jgi:predicted nucleotidyltransferase